jgi:general stress protein YciG
MSGKRGFAAMDKDAQRAIASRGGRAAHARGTAHEFTSEEAAEAGRKGGRTVSRDRRHMAEIGRRGGKAAHSREPVEAPAEQGGEQPLAQFAEHHTAAVGEQPLDNGHTRTNGSIPANGQPPAAEQQPMVHVPEQGMAT